MKTIFAICGSTRDHSSNLQIIKAIEKLIPQNYQLNLFDNIANLPHFNPDLDQNNPPESVKIFRKSIVNADGILLCTPEYAMGLPGSFKNAIDWTVSSASFSKKPILSIVASSLGEKSFESLNHILTVLEVKPIAQLIPFARTKVNRENEITDPETLKLLQANIGQFINEIETGASV
ncbi:NADPH-dependent FMN reductase [Pedobacter paludis]|uniref:Flavoprotein n=1 Tax=Pedobacter paludis TaxID=2203212 RepID=A0A317EZR3_9SPHI|nr:NADPH-dependent FMN reductase [Pedobacter paludis]PWS31129.1 flavoprotein [Pedobacter paludis]